MAVVGGARAWLDRDGAIGDGTWCLVYDAKEQQCERQKQSIQVYETEDAVHALGVDVRLSTCGPSAEPQQ